MEFGYIGLNMGDLDWIGLHWDELVYLVEVIEVLEMVELIELSESVELFELIR